MKLTVATWNINSVRLRMKLVCRFLLRHRPDVLCLQETKSLPELVPTEECFDLGYEHIALRGQKSYNGVMILSRHAFSSETDEDFLGNGTARHVSVRLDNGIAIENCYVPAGGDVPDREVNPKFGEKLDYLNAMKRHYDNPPRKRSLLVGDLNVAPLEDDVWSHRQLLRVVSHTPIEVDALNDVMKSGGWVDISRKHHPDGKLYSWWSYRARDWRASDRGRRLDHIWATADLAARSTSAEILRSARGWERPSDHAPVIASFEI
ncbi:MAG: exodeoxyribonuclease III [Rhodobacteraceae bacterium]|nr:exodeoxyribonuclease III [Paracoccaceae bacterium]